MTLEHSDPWLDIHLGDVRDVLPTLPADSVDCIVTSPPYWGLRDYGEAGQLGLERTPEEYVTNLVAVFRELRRVLKPSGTCWLNLGDSFNEKQLAGIPWRVAFALQADGWYLRSDIIWAKPNPMPESVTDRPTKAHEYLFLLTKSARYYFDADAVREAHALPVWSHEATGIGHGINNGDRNDSDRTRMGGHPAGRNLRSVWTIATRPYPGAHFAVFPPELPERCIKAGSSERGVCPQCGAPWERVVERIARETPYDAYDSNGRAEVLPPHRAGVHRRAVDPTGRGSTLAVTDGRTTGWRPTCACEKDGGGWVPEPAVVLDPFAGSGTVGMVANRLSRRAILVDLNGDYLKQQLKRNAQTPLGLT